MLKQTLFFSMLIMLGGCSPYNAGTHNQSKGICNAIPACQNGQCRQSDSMIQTHCEMLDGQFTPNQRQEKRWWFF